MIFPSPSILFFWAIKTSLAAAGAIQQHAPRPVTPHFNSRFLTLYIHRSQALGDKTPNATTSGTMQDRARGRNTLQGLKNLEALKPPA